MTKHAITNLNILRSESKTSYTPVSGQLLSLPVVQLSWDTREKCKTKPIYFIFPSVRVHSALFMVNSKNKANLQQIKRNVKSD